MTRTRFFPIRTDSLGTEYSPESNQLLVSFATTYPIKKEDLSAIDPDSSMIRYNIQVDQMGYDFFNSYHKLRSYADRITGDIRNLVKDHNIETIHLVISSSVPFTFYLGQQMSTQQFCRILVYHYDSGKYTWGLEIKENDAEKAIVWSQASLAENSH